MSMPFTPGYLKKKKRAQTSVEYVLFILMLSLTILFLGAAFRKKLTQLVQGRFQSYIERQFFTPRALHQFPLNIPR